MDMTLSWAEFVSYWANWTLVFALVLGLLATYAIVVSGNVKEEFLKRDVAESNARALEAQLALEKIKMPRTLGPARQQFVAEAIASFRGQRYRPSISQGADDGLAFWESLYVTFEKAGWIYVPLPPNSFSVGNPPAGIPIAAMPGVEIRFDPTKEPELKPVAKALGDALHADGTVVAVNRHAQSNPDETERDILLIVIGARVPPP
jgi:hypothetical protein